MKDEYEAFDEQQALIKFLNIGSQEASEGKYSTVEEFKSRMNLKYKPLKEEYEGI